MNHKAGQILYTGYLNAVMKLIRNVLIRCRGEFTKLVDKRGWIVPDATVETGRMLSQLKENLLHLKRGQYIFDEYGCLDAAERKAKLGTQTEWNLTASLTESLFSRLVALQSTYCIM